MLNASEEMTIENEQFTYAALTINVAVLTLAVVYFSALSLTHFHLEWLKFVMHIHENEFFFIREINPK